VELQVRDARLTDIDRITALVERADERWTAAQLNEAADLLRQMIYLPNAGVFVALDGRLILGTAVLSLRPSFSAGGLVGTVDLLSVEPGPRVGAVTQALLAELARSARNKGCTLLEANVPDDGAELKRWLRAGFVEAGVRLSSPVGQAVSPTR
jgi:L-amino acid N-acyltransferase YncA